jgi:hypothetical protein
LTRFMGSLTNNRMARYKMVRNISSLIAPFDFEETVFQFSHYKTKNHFFRRFMGELKKNGQAARNQRGITCRVSKLGVGLYFVAWIKDDTLYMKHVVSGNGWPSFSFPKAILEDMNQPLEVEA